MRVHRPECVADEVFMLEVDPIMNHFSFSAFPVRLRTPKRYYELPSTDADLEKAGRKYRQSPDRTPYPGDPLSRSTIWTAPELPGSQGMKAE